MTGNPLIDLAISLAGIAALVALARIMFSGPTADFDATAAAARLAFDEPEFVPVSWSVDQRAKAAIVRNAEGEVAVIVAHGDGLVTRRFAVGMAPIRYANGKLIIARADHTSRTAAISMAADEAQRWLDCLENTGDNNL